MFSGACCGTVGPFFPTAFRLHRDASQHFQVLSYQPLPEGTDPVAATFRAGTGIYFGKGTKIRTYDYATNTIGADIKLTGTGTAIQGIAFDGADLLVTNTDDQLVKVTTSDWTAVPGWTFGLATFGIGVPRSFVISGDQFLIADGDDTHVATDVNRYRLVAINLGPAPPVTAAFTPHVTRGPAPLGVWFIDHSVRADTHAWNFGDGSTSTLVSPAHTFANPGSYVVTLHVTGVGGASDASTTITVLPADTLSGGYTLDGFGGLHPFSTGTGASPPITPARPTGPGGTSPRRGHDRRRPRWVHARRLRRSAPVPRRERRRAARVHGRPVLVRLGRGPRVALMPDGSGGLLVDLVRWDPPLPGRCEPPAAEAGGRPVLGRPGPGRGIAILPDGSGGFVVDRNGGLFAFSLGSGSAPTAPTGVWGPTGRPGGAGRRARQLGPGRLHARRHRWAPPLHASARSRRSPRGSPRGRVGTSPVTWPSSRRPETGRR